MSPKPLSIHQDGSAVATSEAVVHPALTYSESCEGENERKLRIVSEERDALRDEVHAATIEIDRLKTQLNDAEARNVALYELLQKITRNGNPKKDEDGNPRKDEDGNPKKDEGVLSKEEPLDGSASSEDVVHRDVVTNGEVNFIDENEEDEYDSEGDADDDCRSDSDNNSVDNEDAAVEDDEGPDDQDPVPSTPEEDIRLRAARTLIWADSAIKRSSATKSIGAEPSSEIATGTSPSLVQPIGREQVPRKLFTAPIADASSSTLINDRRNSFENDEDGSLSSGSFDSSDRSCDDSSSYTDASADRQRKGPFAGIRQFLDDAMEQHPTPQDPVPPSAASKPPITTKYCNDAFLEREKRKNRTGVLATASASTDNRDEQQQQQPYCNEAFLKLQKKKKSSIFSLF